MKRCNYCGTVAEDNVNFCASCGAQAFTPMDNQNPAPNMGNQPPAPGMGYQPYAAPAPNPVMPAAPAATNINENGNIALGFLGALLFSVLGGVVYVLLYQAEIVASIAGFLMFFLAGVGYRLFAKTKNKCSIAGLVCSIIVTAVMVYLAQYVGAAWTIKDVFGSNMSLLEAVEALPEWLKLPGMQDAFNSDLTMGYVFAAIGCAGSIIAIIKERKQG